MSSVADRVREHRAKADRRAAVTLTVQPHHVEALIEARYLAAWSADDKAAVAATVQRVLDDAARCNGIIFARACGVAFANRIRFRERSCPHRCKICAARAVRLEELGRVQEFCRLAIATASKRATDVRARCAPCAAGSTGILADPRDVTSPAATDPRRNASGRLDNGSTWAQRSPRIKSCRYVCRKPEKLRRSMRYCRRCGVFRCTRELE
jgi:hypothetical protein